MGTFWQFFKHRPMSTPFHKYSIHRIRSFLTMDAKQLLVHVLVISSLVYCN